MITEQDIRNNAPIEIAQVNGKSLKIKSMCANEADEWLGEFGPPLEEMEVKRSKLQREMNIVAQEIDSGESPDNTGDVLHRMEQVRNEIRQADKQYFETIRTALTHFDKNVFTDDVLNAMSVGQLIHCITEVVQLTDPLALTGLLRMARTREMRNTLKS